MDQLQPRQEPSRHLVPGACDRRHHQRSVDQNRHALHPSCNPSSHSHSSGSSSSHHSSSSSSSHSSRPHGRLLLHLCQHQRHRPQPHPRSQQLSHRNPAIGQQTLQRQHRHRNHHLLART